MKKRLKACDRRAQILAVARRLFAQKGGSLPIDELAKACRVSPAVLYQHFSSKEELYGTVLTEAAAAREDYVEAILAGPVDFGSVLYRMTLVYVRHAIEDPDTLRMELRSALDGTEACRYFALNHWKNFSDYIEYSLQELVAAGDIEALDTRFAALMFQGMLRELLYSRAILDVAALRDVEEGYLVRALVDQFLRSVGIRERGGKRFSEVGAPQMRARPRAAASSPDPAGPAAED